MKITEETKIKDLIPEGYELCVEPDQLNCFGFVRIGFNKKKSKILEDYEEELNKSSDRIISKAFFSILKEDYPKQYYSIILQVIADDICKDDYRKYYFFYRSDFKNWDVNSVSITRSPGVVYFDTPEHAKQAIEIMGDKLKLLI